MDVHQGKDKISSGALHMSVSMRRQEFQVQSSGAITRCYSPVCPKGVPAGQNLVIQEESVFARWLCSVQEATHNIGIPPVQILKFLILERFFVETKESIIFLRKIGKCKLPLLLPRRANYF